MPCFFPLSDSMAYKGKIYFAKADTQFLNKTTEYSQMEAKEMCNSETTQIVAVPSFLEIGIEDRTKAILTFLHRIAKKVGEHLHAWAACSGTATPCEAYVVHQTNASIASFRRKQLGNTHAFLALCERGELTINTTLGPCNRT